MQAAGYFGLAKEQDPISRFRHDLSCTESEAIRPAEEDVVPEGEFGCSHSVSFGLMAKKNPPAVKLTG
jgi:hypothetical protein